MKRPWAGTRRSFPWPTSCRQGAAVPGRFCHDRVQAIVYTVGHPNISVGQAAGALRRGDGRGHGAAIDKLIERQSLFAATEIPGGIYAGNPEPVTTFGVKATVVSLGSELDEETGLCTVVKACSTTSTASSRCTRRSWPRPARMITDGLSAPLHEGALRYFREQGLMKAG